MSVLASNGHACGARTFDRAPEALTVAVRENGTTTDVAATGEWDLAQAPLARDVIHAALQRRPECVVLDLSQLSFIDSSAIHIVLELHSRCAAEGVRLVIIPGPRAVQRPFEICGLTERLPFLVPGA
jgi:anti-sigma B factor antagonist